MGDEQKKNCGHEESALLTCNIFLHIVPLSASSTTISLLALPAVLTALMHCKMVHKTFPSWQLLRMSQRNAMFEQTALAELSMRPVRTILGRYASGAL